MKNEGLIMYRIEFKWNDVLTCTHTYTHFQWMNEWVSEWMNEWMINEVKECELKGEFWGDQPSWVEMKCLVAISFCSKRFLRFIGGWMPFMSWDVVFKSYP